jgi:DNA-binding transcriptional MerR regulator
MKSHKHYHIKDVVALTGIKSHTLRVWEQRYDFIQPRRTDTNIRYYCEEDLRKLLNITLLYKQGTKLNQLAKMTENEICQCVKKLCTDCTQNDGQLQELYMGMLQFNEAIIKNILNNSFANLGVTHTMLHLVYPLLNKIGLMWQAGCIKSAHEHFISNIIVQKLISITDQQAIAPKSDAIRFILFLPEGEKHDISIHFANHLLQKRGCKVLFLGGNQPILELDQVIDTFDPEFIFTSITTAISYQNLGDLNILSSGHKSVKFLLTGSLMIENGFNLPNNCKILKSPLEFENLIDNKLKKHNIVEKLAV